MRKNLRDLLSSVYYQNILKSFVSNKPAKLSSRTWSDQLKHESRHNNVTILCIITETDVINGSWWRCIALPVEIVSMEVVLVSVIAPLHAEVVNSSRGPPRCFITECGGCNVYAGGVVAVSCQERIFMILL